MITLTSIGEKYEFTATLIDFDNSSVKNELYISTERQKIEKDFRSMTRRHGIGENIITNWNYAD